MRHLVSEGADLTRCHALICAVLNGVTSRAHLGLLVSLGANPSGADEFGQTALHATAELIGHSEPTQAGAVEAAKALIALGASCTVTDLHRDTPLDALLKKMRDFADFEGTFGLGRRWNGRDNELYKYELVHTLLTPEQQAALVFGVLTPRQDHRLRFYAEVRADMARDSLPGFQNRVPRPSEDLDWEVPLWNHIPKSVKGEEVYKSFVGGWVQVLEAIKELHSPMANRHSATLPTVSAVTQELLQGRYRYDQRYTDFFFRNGGKVEFAIDGLLCLAEDADEFFDVFFGDYSEGNGGEEYEALSEHPLDDVWGFARYKLLGPTGKVPKGPFD